LQFCGEDRRNRTENKGVCNSAHRLAETLRRHQTRCNRLGDRLYEVKKLRRAAKTQLTKQIRSEESLTKFANSTPQIGHELYLRREAKIPKTISARPGGVGSKEGGGLALVSTKRIGRKRYDNRGGNQVTQNSLCEFAL